MLISSLFFPPPFQIGAVSHSAVTVVEGGEVSEYNILWDGREDVGHQRTFVSGNHRCVLRTKPQPNSIFLFKVTRVRFISQWLHLQCCWILPYHI